MHVAGIAIRVISQVLADDVALIGGGVPGSGPELLSREIGTGHSRIISLDPAGAMYGKTRLAPDDIEHYAGENERDQDGCDYHV